MKQRHQALALALALVAVSGARKWDSELPRTLRADAATRGCTQVADFYDKPGRVDPPFVFGYLDSEADPHGEWSAVYWCERTQADERFLLVVWIGEPALEAVHSCPRTLEWRNPPAGLSIQRRARVQLSAYWPRSNPQARGPNVVATGPLIVDSYDGAGASFFCHAGEWYVQQHH
jgi:hypothetical protein